MGVGQSLNKQQLFEAATSHTVNLYYIMAAKLPKEEENEIKKFSIRSWKPLMRVHFYLRVLSYVIVQFKIISFFIGFLTDNNSQNHHRRPRTLQNYV